MSNKSSHLLDALMRGRPQPNPRGSQGRPTSPRTAEFRLTDEIEPEEVEPQAEEVPDPEPPPEPEEPAAPAPRVERIRVTPAAEQDDEILEEEEPPVVITPRRAAGRSYDSYAPPLPAEEPSILGDRRRSSDEEPRGAKRRGDITVSQQEALLVALLVLVLIVGAFVLGRRTASPAPVESGTQQTASLDFESRGTRPGPGGAAPALLPVSLVAIEYDGTDDGTAKTMAGRLARELRIDAWVAPSPKRGKFAVLVGHFASESDPGLLELRETLKKHVVNGMTPFANTTYPTRVAN